MRILSVGVLIALLLVLSLKLFSCEIGCGLTPTGTLPLVLMISGALGALILSRLTWFILLASPSLIAILILIAHLGFRLQAPEDCCTSCVGEMTADRALKLIDLEGAAVDRNSLPMIEEVYSGTGTACDVTHQACMSFREYYAQKFSTFVHEAITHFGVQVLPRPTSNCPPIPGRRIVEVLAKSRGFYKEKQGSECWRTFNSTDAWCFSQRHQCCEWEIERLIAASQ